MSLADHHITALMRQIASQDAVELFHPNARLQTLSALVYIAECYGFRYADVRRVGKHKHLHVYLVRDTDPRAQARAAANAAAFPQAGGGGPVPGMRQGSLTPLPEAQADVDLITALLRYDTLGTANRRQLITRAWGSAALFGLMAPITGKYAVLLPLAVLVPAFVLGGLRVNTTRRATLARQLTAAGCAPVRDEHGRERYVRPVPHAA